MTCSAGNKMTTLSFKVSTKGSDWLISSIKPWHWSRRLMKWKTCHGRVNGCHSCAVGEGSSVATGDTII